MSLSPNSIIHFTKKLDTIKSILRDGLKAKYCKETICISEEEISFHVPMISFCDIQLHKVQEHIEKYGCYGIGLSKEWAYRNKLNPVLYINKSSHLTKNLLKSFKSTTSDTDNVFFEKFDVFRFMKNYEGLLKRNDTTNNYRFADEREWRYVPSLDEWQKYPIYFPDKDDELTQLNLNLKSAVCLKIEPDDIKYIFIESEDEITETISIIDSIFSSKNTTDSINKLKTRIVTHDQITTDI